MSNAFLLLQRVALSAESAAPTYLLRAPNMLLPQSSASIPSKLPAKLRGPLQYSGVPLDVAGGVYDVHRSM